MESPTRRLLLSGLLAPWLSQTSARTVSRPVFRVDVPAPTKDKPQSKLWFAHGTWWAWLPVSGGSSIWRRTGTVWQRERSLDAPLQGFPGQADVWTDDDRVDAVLVASDRLAVARLQWNAATGTYHVTNEPDRIPVQAGDVETATLARDGRNRLWISYNSGRSMWARAATAPGAWTSPIRITSAEASADDICAIVRIPGAVGVIWSDQTHDAVYFRLHPDGAPDNSWSPAEIVDSGGKTADDHINAVSGHDGTLYVATKNSVDLAGSPQLVLRIRDPRGNWSNQPYALRLSESEPTRPIVLLAGRPQRLFLLHTLGLKGRPSPASSIVCQATSAAKPDTTGPARVLIEGAQAVNNVTRAKQHAPDGQPAIVLASDNLGNVYEGRLP